MPFQPFGYRFDLASDLSPADLKARIRARKKPWFDPKNGARGWIVGPYVCLWLSALDRTGPSLLGRIIADGPGSRISGRAGSNLAGVTPVALGLPLMALLCCAFCAAGDPALALGFAVLVPVSALVFWTNHANRKSADPLVRFLGDTAAGTPKSSPPRKTRTVVDAAPKTTARNEKGGRSDR